MKKKQARGILYPRAFLFGKTMTTQNKTFEDIWNEAELLSKKIQDVNVDEIIERLHSRVDILKNSVNLPKEQAVNIGEILFEIAYITQLTQEKTNKQVNVAAGMQLAIESKRAELFDSDE